MFNQEESDRKKSDEAEVDSLEVTNTIEVVATASMVSGCKKVSTFAADAIQGQFPRPTSSLAKKQTRMQNLADIASDLNKENWTMKLDEGTGKDGVKMNKSCKDDADALAELSMRQLTKMLKEQLEIANNKKSQGKTTLEVVGKRRTMKTLSESCMPVEPDSNNH
ncbi:hypothetical protein LINPERHAP1_LOCUS8441 [Linum perenne]